MVFDPYRDEDLNGGNFASPVAYQLWFSQCLWCIFLGLLCCFLEFTVPFVLEMDQIIRREWEKKNRNVLVTSKYMTWFSHCALLLSPHIVHMF